jgi:hypothetical protein
MESQRQRNLIQWSLPGTKIGSARLARFPMVEKHGVETTLVEYRILKD